MSFSPHLRVGETYAEDHPDADPSATEVVINALVVGSLLSDAMESVLRPFGLTVGSFHLLSIVSGSENPLTPTEIAQRSLTKVTTATVTGLLHTCERNGLVRRTPHATDRRRVLVHMTPAGRALLREVEPAIAAAERRWVGPLSESRRAALLRGLGELRLALEAAGD